MKHMALRDGRQGVHGAERKLMVWGILVGVIIIGGTILATLGAYSFMRRVTGGDPEGVDRDLASSVVFRISALHGLILALVFAQEMFQYEQLKYASATEADAVADVYFDAGRYDPLAKLPIQKALGEYARLVIEEEWPALATERRLSQAAWNQWDAAYQAVLDLAPANKRQESLRDHMLQQVHVISQQRIQREATVGDSINGIFWVAALSGVVFIALAYYPYQPDRRSLMLIAMFGAYTGIILFFIYAFSDPYRPPAELSPGAFVRLQQQIAISG